MDLVHQIILRRQCVVKPRNNLKYFYSQPMDMDYFEEATDTLLNKQSVMSDKGVGVAGISKGGEIALAMASCLPKNKIGSVAVMNTVMNFGLVPVTHKGQTVCKGRKL